MGMGQYSLNKSNITSFTRTLTHHTNAQEQEMLSCSFFVFSWNLRLVWDLLDHLIPPRAEPPSLDQVAQVSLST